MDESSQAPSPGRRKRRAALVAVVVLAVAGGLAAGWVAYSLTERIGGSATGAAEIEGFLWPDPPRVAEFELTDHDGKPFDRGRLLGRWSMLYFGYTHCPDACPITLTVLREVEKQLERTPSIHERFQGVFVSVDPARDSLEHLGRYVAYFSSRFIGVTGEEERLSAATRGFGVVYRLAEPDESGSYLVDHTSSLLLVDPRGRLVGVFGLPHEAKDLAERIERIERVLAG